MEHYEGRWKIARRVEIRKVRMQVILNPYALHSYDPLVTVVCCRMLTVN